MYLPAHFQQTSVPPLHALIRAHPLGILVTQLDGALDANHLPFELLDNPAPNGTLRGHVARSNPLWTQMASGSRVLVIFRGADGEGRESRPWRMDESAPGYIDERLRAIVGIEIVIDQLLGKFKLSQNEEPRDRHGAADELAQRGNLDLAAAMRTSDEG